MTVEWVEIIHPDLDAPSAKVTRTAFEAVHKQRGFVLVEDEKPKKKPTKKETE
jgi:hypothetical protein